MVGPIERVRRLLPKRPMVPVMMLVVCANVQVDPTRRATGYGGVLPIPGPTVSPPVAGTRPDPLVEQQRKDQRASRGRVLYAPGRAPHDTSAMHNARAHKAPCTLQRVGQGRGVSPSPTS